MWVYFFPHIIIWIYIGVTCLMYNLYCTLNALNALILDLHYKNIPASLSKCLFASHIKNWELKVKVQSEISKWDILIRCHNEHWNILRLVTKNIVLCIIFFSLHFFYLSVSVQKECGIADRQWTIYGTESIEGNVMEYSFGDIRVCGPVLV